MATSTVENYVKRLFLEQQRSSRRLVPMGRLAKVMGVVPGTATTMVKALADSGLVEYQPRGGTRLTPGGERLALHVLRRHRLVELFLVEVLRMDWSEVHDEAERLEHAISDKVLERMDSFLGSPSVDPHGDPIPTRAGAIQRPEQATLVECAPGTEVRIARILDQGTKFLQFIDRSGLTPGTRVRLTDRDPVADSVTVEAASRPPLTLGATAARKILVENAD